MAKTLYVSDLDGTLLDREGWLSEYTIQVVRRMIDDGKLFTIATARSLPAANDLIWYLGLRLPVVLANGSTIYDTIRRRYLHVDPIPLNVIPNVLWIVESYHICGFLYALRDEKISVYYRHLWQEWDLVYHATRVERYNGRIYQSKDLMEVAHHNMPVYMVACGPKEVLYAIQRDLEHLSGISSEIYEDVYNSFFYMDIFSSASSKTKGMLALQEITGAQELVAFGDNFNDMQMLLAADRAYVPRNGVLAAQHLADGVLDYAHRDGVAHFLAKEFGWE